MHFQVDLLVVLVSARFQITDVRVVKQTFPIGGEGEEEHPLLWHEVKEDKPLICAEWSS